MSESNWLDQFVSDRRKKWKPSVQLELETMMLVGNKHSVAQRFSIYLNSVKSDYRNDHVLDDPDAIFD